MLSRTIPTLSSRRVLGVSYPPAATNCDAMGKDDFYTLQMMYAESRESIDFALAPDPDDPFLEGYMTSPQC